VLDSLIPDKLPYIYCKCRISCDITEIREDGVGGMMGGAAGSSSTGTLGSTEMSKQDILHRMEEDRERVLLLYLRMNTIMVA
jgi:hypothetical protein